MTEDVVSSRGVSPRPLGPPAEQAEPCGGHTEGACRPRAPRPAQAYRHVAERACTNLDDEARVSASTVSYHVKTHPTAGLVQVRKEGCSFHYKYRPDVIRSLAEALRTMG